MPLCVKGCAIEIMLVLLSFQQILVYNQDLRNAEVIGPNTPCGTTSLKEMFDFAKSLEHLCIL